MMRALYLWLVITIRVAGQAGGAIVLITRYFIMVIIGWARLMTGQTGKDRVVVRIGVAIGTLIPGSFV